MTDLDCGVERKMSDESGGERRWIDGREGKQTDGGSFSDDRSDATSAHVPVPVPSTGGAGDIVGRHEDPREPNLRQSHVDGGRKAEAEVEAEKLPVVPTPKQSGEGRREGGRPCSAVQ